MSFGPARRGYRDRDAVVGILVDRWALGTLDFANDGKRELDGDSFDALTIVGRRHCARYQIKSADNNAERESDVADIRTSRLHARAGGPLAEKEQPTSVELLLVVRIGVVQEYLQRVFLNLGAGREWGSEEGEVSTCLMSIRP